MEQSPIVSYFSSFELLTDEALSRLDRLTEKQILRKGEYWLKEGSVCRSVSFIISGIMRQSFLNQAGDDVTSCFFFQHDAVAAYASIITGNPSDKSVIALTDCELLTASYDTLIAILEDDPVLDKILRKIAENEFMIADERLSSFLKYTAKERYRQLIEKQPQFIQQIPLQYLASYLGITPQHMSRIRKELFS